MNKYISLLLIVLLSSCMGKHKSDAQTAEVSEQVSSATGTAGDSLPINISKSKVFWKGTKMHGTKKHSGEIAIKKGFFVVKDDELIGGSFLVDMHSIQVTDIPKSDPIPIRNITNHLKHDEFFDVVNYPTSRFEISNIQKANSDTLNVSGNLTLKDVTKNIVFKAFKKGKTFSTKFTIDRFQWNVGHKDTWANKRLVDKDIELIIEIVLDQRVHHNRI